MYPEQNNQKRNILIKMNKYLAPALIQFFAV